MDSPSTRAHRREAPTQLTFAVIVVSTSAAAYRRGDISGGLIRDKVVAAGHQARAVEIVPDDAAAIRAAIRSAAREADVIVTTGGTGLTLTDVTAETAREFLVKELPGFATLFTQLSYAEAGPACLLSRACAGVIEGGRVLFVLPGSPKACQLAVEKLILPEAGHILKHCREP